MVTLGYFCWYSLTRASRAGPSSPDHHEKISSLPAAEALEAVDRMVAAVAKARGYDLTQPHIRSAVLLSLVGADADDLLAKAGVVVPTGRLTALAAERLPGPALMVVNKAIGFRILATSGKSIFKRFGRNVPLIGGAVGAGLDGWVLHKIADKAREEFVTAAPQITA